MHILQEKDISVTNMTPPHNTKNDLSININPCQIKMIKLNIYKMSFLANVGLRLTLDS